MMNSATRATSSALAVAVVAVVLLTVFVTTTTAVPFVTTPATSHRISTITSSNFGSVVLSLSGGDSTAMVDDDDEYDYESEDEEEEEDDEVDLDPSMAKSAMKATKKVQEKATKTVKSQVSSAISSGKAAATSVSSERKSSNSFLKKFVPYIVRAAMNPFTVIQMTKGYWASLFNLDYLKQVRLLVLALSSV